MNEQKKLKFLTYMQLLLKIILVALLFVEGMFVIETHVNDYRNFISRDVDYPQSSLDVVNRTPSPDHEFAALYGTHDVNMSTRGHYSLNNDFCVIMWIVVFAFLLLDIVIDLFSLFKRINYKKWRIILPIVTFIIFILISILHIFDGSEINISTITDFSTGTKIPYMDFSANVTLGAWFYVALAIFLAVVVINLYNMALSDKKLSDNVSRFSIKLKKNESVPEELEKYKELMDNNVITKEEFEAKKKQLLDL